MLRFNGDLNDEMQLALVKMRDWCKDQGLDENIYDDYYRLRFLRARKFHMDNTILMFTNNLAWRRDNEVDQILDVSRAVADECRYSGLRSQSRSRNTTLIITTR
jgi:hypothetical protein